jgi:hypothetical protein
MSDDGTCREKALGRLVMADACAETMTMDGWVMSAGYF